MKVHHLGVPFMERKIDKKGVLDKVVCHGQKKLIKLRPEVNRLHFMDGLSKNAIVRRHHVSKHFVARWTQAPDQDFEADGRGWPVGCRRKWPQDLAARVAELHQDLKSDPRAFYWGATAIAQVWRQRYPDEPPPPLRTLGQVLHDLGLTGKYRGRQKGAAR